LQKFARIAEMPTEVTFCVHPVYFSRTASVATHKL